MLLYPGPIYRTKVRKNKIQVKLYEICGFKTENESKDLFQKTLTEMNDPRKMMLLEKMIVSVQKT